MNAWYHITIHINSRPVCYENLLLHKGAVSKASRSHSLSNKLPCALAVHSHWDPSTTIFFGQASKLPQQDFFSSLSLP
jgi:hypothetical protein